MFETLKGETAIGGVPNNELGVVNIELDCDVPKTLLGVPALGVSFFKRSVRYSSSFLHWSQTQSGSCLYDRNLGGRPSLLASFSSSAETCVSDTISMSESPPALSVLTSKQKMSCH